MLDGDSLTLDGNGSATPFCSRGRRGLACMHCSEGQAKGGGIRVTDTLHADDFVKGKKLGSLRVPAGRAWRVPQMLEG